MKTKGFTLIELLIVIAILAILATAVALVLNPAELLKQGRDSTRLSDLATLQSALGLYVADVAGPTFSEEARCTGGNTTQLDGSATCVDNSVTTVGGAGWVGVDLTKISGGSPLSRLPLDPTDDGTYYYVYDANNASSTFELNANLESAKFTVTQNLEAKDGGSDDTIYEVGTFTGLGLLP